MNLIIGAILGFISVAFGAYAEHGLKSQISAEHFDFVMTAVRYNQAYAIVISGIGIALLSSKSLARCLTLKLSNLFFIVGTILFSFSIYISVVYNIPIILKLAPLGGATLMIGWLMLILAAVFLKNNLKRSL
ncbi:DUF423 domain-containing protein [Francisella philomiragia]|uniref:DUF423 domain-containing protein n=1 Tax=Francisella philomiragia TaxID=28110 RepID=UPI002243B9F2|nr:DUF423 domain-containing protein [Francisella philomiragia]